MPSAARSCGARDTGTYSSNVTIQLAGVATPERRVQLRFTRPTVVLAVTIVLGMSGCGYKAPLYLPKPKAERARPAPAVVTPETPQDHRVPSEAAPPPQ